jgi:hypothetical protein
MNEYFLIHGDRPIGRVAQIILNRESGRQAGDPPNFAQNFVM